MTIPEAICLLCVTTVIGLGLVALMCCGLEHGKSDDTKSENVVK